jgi:probable addiction module antidote protein
VPKSISRTTRNARRRNAAASLAYEPWLIGQLKDPAEAAAYLEAVLEQGDQGAIMIALRRLAKVARKAHLTREATYKMLSRTGNPELRSLSAILKATGLRIAVKPIGKRAP